MHRRSNIGLLIAQICVVVVLVLLVALKPVPWTAARVLGVVLMVVSAGFLFLARIQLGDSFSLTAQAHQLVTHGIYSKIRNPIYVFGALLLAGFALALQVPALLLILVVVIPMQIMRARREGKVLEGKFGDAYRQYRAKTWF